MTLCRHRQHPPCEWCLSQDYFWSGSRTVTPPAKISVPVGLDPYPVTEGSKNPKLEGLMLRPAAVALARAIDREPFEDLRVIELGAGLGLPGRVAAWNGNAVILSENDKTIAAAVGDEVDLYFDDISVTSFPWSEIPGQFDSIIGSEILYNVELIRACLDFVRERWTGRGPAIFADPGRQREAIAREAPLRGVVLTRRQINETMMDGKTFACDLWQATPRNP